MREGCESCVLNKVCREYGFTEHKLLFCSETSGQPEKEEQKWRSYFIARAKKDPAYALPPAINEPVGTELQNILESLGITDTLGCGCKAMVRRMDKWGIHGCTLNRTPIINQLRKRAKKRGWDEYFTAAQKSLESGLAFRLNWLDPIPDLLTEAMRRVSV